MTVAKSKKSVVAKSPWELGETVRLCMPDGWCRLERVGAIADLGYVRLFGIAAKFSFEGHELDGGKRRIEKSALTTVLEPA